jgi:hypothetical protein
VVINLAESALFLKASFQVRVCSIEWALDAFSPDNIAVDSASQMV